MSRVIKLAIRGHLEGKLIHFNFTYTMNLGWHLPCGGRCLYTHILVSYAHKNHGFQEVGEVGAARTHPDKLRDKNPM
jgi:hypothetical protein